MQIFDIETLKRCFLFVGLDPHTIQFTEFEVSHRRNDLDALVAHLLRYKDYLISFNGLGFDGQVLQLILDDHKNWYDLTNREIIERIYAFAQQIIDNQQYENIKLPYWEGEFRNKHIDLFKIHHFDNEAKRTSLKWLEFTMDSPNVEEMPIWHGQETLTSEEIDIVKEYCRNDVINTHLFYKYTIGEIEGNSFYAGINMIQDRLDLIEEMTFPDRAVNWNNVKIGDEINKKSYCELTGKKPWELYDLKASRKPTSQFTYGDCIPSYVTFKNPVFQKFYEAMKGVRVNLNEKEEYPFTYRGTNYVIAKGGIHSNEKNRIIICQKSWILRDADIGGQYPHSIIKRGLFPSHLGKLWLVGFASIRDKRDGFKKKAKLSKKFKGLAEQFKYAQNGGGFGKTNDRNNWQYDPFVHFQCTIGNQFEILMLIEWMEDAGIHVVSANTDGIVCYYPKDLDPVYKELCTKWEGLVGNDIMGKLEFTDYQKLIQGSVNDYLAIKMDGELKKKGDFATEFELHKNPSRRIIAIALQHYFVENIPVEITISNHTRIYDFCIGVKASKDYHYEAVNKDGSSESYSRLVRYFVSTNGKKLYKVKNEDSEAQGVNRLLCEAGGGNWKCTIANKIKDEVPIKDYKIDYQYYIQKAQERIDALERGGKGKKVDPNQINLF